jgi:hypothetical protein
MNRVSIDLQNCYGIGKLSHQFNFSGQKAYAIYAPNGSMKSCLAQTFKDVADGVDSKDRIFSGRKTVRKITDENGAELPKESVLVLAPYDEFFGHTEKTSTLLVNNVLRKEFEQLHADIEKSKATFLKAMKAQSGGSNKELEKEIALAFTKKDDENSFYIALERAKIELAEQKDAPFKDVEYDAIFDDKVLDALKGKDVKTAIKEYITQYNALLAASTYFKRGVFEYYNASQIAKTLTDNGFFEAKHTITLHATKKLEISTTKELEELIKKELEQITEDSKLKKTFADLKKLLEKNSNVRAFQRYLCDHELLLPHLENTDQFKEEIWRSYFKANEGAFNNLLDDFRRVKTRRKEIEEEARKERTQWENAIDLFNDRFFVPFTLEAKNKAEVVLKHEPILDLNYTFKDDKDSAQVERKTLMQVLSEGEKKALYILNIIFEIEVRRQSNTETLFVIDDIADSFDYKNKYAIIQYLQDISEGPIFKLIMLTHNFDFFRTINSRAVVPYSQCLMATKIGTEVRLDQAAGIENIFINDWKKNFFTDKRKKIASIAFMRNLIEYIRGNTDRDYMKLTSLVHWKADSARITQGDLDAVYANLFGPNGSSPSAESAKPVVDIIEQEAKGCLGAGGGVNFEHKVVLSIAIRLAAEKFMANKIADATFLAGIEKNQTQALLKKFREVCSGEVDAIKTLEGVVLMTPENIHLNSFMYEPILDMSDDHLKKLYAGVLALK